MSVKNFTLTTGFLFLIMGLLQISRILYGRNISIEGYGLPLWGSGAIALFAFFLSFESFRISRKSY
ncbi:MAG: hypothetical protein AAB556_01375 [Patescibacteria group bacterium]